MIDNNRDNSKLQKQKKNRPNTIVDSISIEATMYDNHASQYKSNIIQTSTHDLETGKPATSSKKSKHSYNDNVHREKDKKYFCTCGKSYTSMIYFLNHQKMKSSPLHFLAQPQIYPKISEAPRRQSPKPTVSRPGLQKPNPTPRPPSDRISIPIPFSKQLPVG